MLFLKFFINNWNETIPHFKPPQNIYLDRDNFYLRWKQAEPERLSQLAQSIEEMIYKSYLRRSGLAYRTANTEMID